MREERIRECGSSLIKVPYYHKAVEFHRSLAPASYAIEKVALWLVIAQRNQTVNYIPFQTMLVHRAYVENECNELRTLSATLKKVQYTYVSIDERLASIATNLRTQWNRMICK